MNLEPWKDPSRWSVTLLPVPKRQKTARGFGFCGGFAVGDSEGSGYRTTPHWWREGDPVALAVPGKKDLAVRGAQGRQIAGGWNGADGPKGAIGWRLDGARKLKATTLHVPAKYTWTLAMAAGGGAF